MGRVAVLQLSSARDLPSAIHNKEEEPGAQRQRSDGELAEQPGHEEQIGHGIIAYVNNRSSGTDPEGEAAEEWEARWPPLHKAGEGGPVLCYSTVGGWQ